MTPDEKTLISGLFQRLKDAEAQLGAKDREAEDLIRQSVAAQPTAPYLLVQTVLVQEHALANATTRIAELEKQLAEAKAPAAQSQSGGGGGSFLGNMAEKLGPWGRRPSAQPAGSPAGGQAAQQQAPVPMAQPAMAYGQPAPMAPTAQMAPQAGGGFLRSALTTAAGVAGGALLFQGISSLLSHNSGAFGPGLASHDAGASAWGGTGAGGGGETVINNYYGNSPDPAAGAGWQPDDTGAAPGYQDSGWNNADAGADYADDGGSFDGGGGGDDY